VRPTYVLVALTVPSGPPGARLSTGSADWAQYDEGAPSVPITLGSRAIARAFAAHFSGAGYAGPDGGVPSQTWKPIPYGPARNARCSSTSVIAPRIDLLRKLAGPCRLRSAAIR